MRDFRFSCTVFAIRSQAEFTGYAVAAEEAGYDVLFTTDHLGSPAPFPPLVAAAAATRRLRVGTLVLNAGFWNPHLLAREVATVDLLTGGRLELGLGAGHMKWEYDAAGIPWPAFAERAARLAATLDEMERVFAAEEGYPEGAPGREFFGLPVQAPVQRRADRRPGPPLIIGGTGDRILALAARRADTVALAGAVQVPGQPPGTFRMATAAEAADRVRYIREQAGERFGDLELSVLIQAVVITDDRRATAEELAAERFAPFTPGDVLDTPFLLIGTIGEIADQLRERRERYGFSFITVHEPFMRAFAPVIERVRAT
jgi:probable F420-dependent oxidoreductase